MILIESCLIQQQKSCCITKHLYLDLVKKLVEYHTLKISNYREMTRAELVKLTESSTWCEQLVDYDCYRAPLQ